MDSLKFRFFTLDEANELLPQVRSIFLDINREKGRLVKRLNEIGELKNNVAFNGNRAALKEKLTEVLAIQGKLSEDYTELLEQGLIIRDLNEGIVDFPTIAKKDLAYFCWRMGEHRINFWHPIGDNVRRPISSDLKFMDQHTPDEHNLTHEIMRKEQKTEGNEEKPRNIPPDTKHKP